MITKDLKKYLKEEILPLYEKNDWAHQSWHIYEVIERSLRLTKNLDVNLDMVYTIAVFHDIACHQGRENHEINSSLFLKNDQNLKKWFTPKEIKIMEEAIADHRASLTHPPRSIYGKIISTADRFTTIKGILRSTLLYYLEFFPEKTSEEMFDGCFQYIKKKYGPQGYGKTYLPSEEYEKFLKEVAYYLEHKQEMKKIFYEVFHFCTKIYNVKKDDPEFIKHYFSLDEFYQKKFGTKVFKVSLNAGFSCPNNKNGHGCIFCSNNSGDFAGNVQKDLVTQFYEIKKTMEKKWPNSKYIAYFQAATNTYAPLKILKEKYESVLNLPGVVGLSIATRSDAITDEILDYLTELNKKTFLTIELGLQSIHEKTLKLIHRGHTLENFEKMVKKLKQRNIHTVVHIINGLPNETKEMMLETVKYLNNLKIDGLKIHMLHILKNTPLEDLYQKKPFPLLTKDEFINIVCDQLELLDKNIVIHRLTGDPKKEDLIAPLWVLKKFTVLNDIDKEFIGRHSYQGKLSR
ncbi:MAG: TIGR01212 family radical SAM protein [Bacilli bacterium]|nr:TIGR01212 family radical SAM protein [Bacilli bacterium]